ncbi:ScyD/ScyE family protein [uncultured Pseudokineococcus sp.]|uniref:ScyD/ScyE family protein n=1 Tax=uncultured Pseudokineococcus sp. TaxID=1642928 RepID=UPI00260E4F78|nr:ScyD/ScyE family protein [uncultured Pseudokineococcus sp.]
MDEPVWSRRVATTTSSTRCASSSPPASPRRRSPAGGALAAVATAALVLAGAPAATADDGPSTTVVAEGLVGPLSLDVTPRGDVVVAQSFAGALTRVDRRGARTDLAALPGAEVAGVTASAGGVLYTHSLGQGPDAVALLERVDHRGRTEVVADLGEHERAANPDGGTTYGLRDLAQDCLDQLPPDFPATYPGEVYSHPYATADARAGRTVVADAGGNALLSVDARGRVSTLAVLPAQPAVVSPGAAEQFGLPACAVGETFWFEAVPTDVEVGPDGGLYVSLLPGGPEDPSLGARGSVVRVDPGTGEVETVIGGLLAASGVAVDDDGTVYATELFGGRVVAMDPGATAARTVLEVELPAAVEVAGDHLYVTTQALGPAGQVVRLDL